MTSMITASATAFLAVLLLGAMATDDSASPSDSDTARDSGVPLQRILTTVAKKTGKKYLLDPRVHAQVHLIGQDPTTVSYSELLIILQVYGFVAVEGGGYIRVIPNADARQAAQPLASAGQTYPDAQFVSYIIPVRNGPVAPLVPILRPLLPQVAQLAAYPCSNSILIVDSFANVKRIEAIVKSLDVGTPYQPQKCEWLSPAAPGAARPDNARQAATRASSAKQVTLAGYD